MEYNIYMRQNQLENFQQFIDSAKSNLETLLDTLGWTEEQVKKVDHLETCTYNKNHRVALNHLEEHHKICSLKQLGYNLDDIQLSEPPDNIYTSILIDNSKKDEIFKKARMECSDFKAASIGCNGNEANPKTADRLMSTFSPDERLALYNFAVSATEGPKIPPDFNLNQPDEDERELTYEERLEHERNAKRRRIKYKTVHTNRKNHTEVMREVISNQMDLYKDYLVDKEETTRMKDRPPSQNQIANVKEEKQECDEILNGSQDETRSAGSKQSAHSATSSHYKSKTHASRGSSCDYRDRDRYRERDSKTCESDRKRGNDTDYTHEKRPHFDRNRKSSRGFSRSNNDNGHNDKYRRYEKEVSRRRSHSRESYKRSRISKSPEKGHKKYDKNGQQYDGERKRHAYHYDQDEKKRRISRHDNGNHHTRTANLASRCRDS